MHKLKLSLFLLMLYVANPGYGQEKNTGNLRAAFIKFIEINALITSADTCFYWDNFVKIAIDRQSRVTAVEVSDGSAPRFKEELKRYLKNQRDAFFGTLSKACKKDGLRNCNYAFLFIYRSESLCAEVQKYLTPPGNFFRFNNESLTGSHLILGDVMAVKNSRIKWQH